MLVPCPAELFVGFGTGGAAGGGCVWRGHKTESWIEFIREIEADNYKHTDLYDPVLH